MILRKFAEEYQAHAGHPCPTYRNGPLNRLDDIILRLRNDYVNEIDSKKLSDVISAAVRSARADDSCDEVVDAATKAMLRSLDPNSTYITQERLLQMGLFNKGLELGDIGAKFRPVTDGLKIYLVREGSSAAKEGLRPGDIITHLDGEPLLNLSESEASDRLDGDVGSEIHLAIRRGTEKFLNVKVIREPRKLGLISSDLKDGFAYIRISEFVESTDRNLREAIRLLKKGSLGHIGAYVLDLRSNPGGLLDQSVSVSAVFLNTGEILSTRSRNLKDCHVFNALGNDLTNGTPIAVLIDHNTYGAAEIVAAALQDNHRATVIGERSYGGGSVQTIMPMPPNGALKITTANFYTPSGRQIDGVGVEPDNVIVPTDNYDPDNRKMVFGDRSRDIVLVQAIDILRTKISH